MVLAAQVTAVAGSDCSLAVKWTLEVPLKIPEWLPSAAVAMRQQRACSALCPGKPKDSGDWGEKAEG